MLYEAAWRARISRILSGALRIWGVSGTISPDPDEVNGLLVTPTAGPQIRVRHDAPAGWVVALRDPASGAPAPLSRHAGLPGLLRRLREELAPDAPAGRLVIGAQPLLERDPREP